MGMAGVRVRTVAGRLAFLMTVAIFCAITLAVVDGLGRRAVEARLAQSLDAIASAYQSSAEASLDYGLPVNGPGSVESILRPPAVLTDGADGLSLRLERQSAADPRREPVSAPTRDQSGSMVVAERTILDSHGEVSARLILSRSTTGLNEDFRARERALAFGLAGLVILTAGLLLALPPARVLLWPAILFLPATALLLASFGSQLVDISRQAAQLAVADTSSDLARAAQLGIPFEQLVGMQDYLRQQVSSNPAIGRMELSGPSGIAFAAAGDGLGSAVTDLLVASPQSYLLSDFVVEQRLESGVTLRAAVNIQPVLADLMMPVLVSLVLCIAFGAALWVLFVDRVEHAMKLSSALASPALFFCLLFLVFGLQLGASQMDRHWQAWLVAASAAVGFLIPLRLAIPTLMAALAIVALGLWGDAAMLLAGAGLCCGLGLARSPLVLKPVHLAASLLPSVGLLSVWLFDLMPSGPSAKAVVVLLAVLVVPVVRAAGRSTAGQAEATGAGSFAGLATRRAASLFFWLCLFVLQTSGYLLLVIAALRAQGGLPGQYGQSVYLLLCVLLFLLGNQAAARFAHASRLRWILCEICVFGVVLLTAWSHVGDGNLFVTSAIAAMLMGGIAHWTASQSFVRAHETMARSVNAGVGLLAFAVAVSIALSLGEPSSGALPAILLFLAAFAPLAFATIAGLGAPVGRMFSRGSAS